MEVCSFISSKPFPIRPYWLLSKVSPFWMLDRELLRLLPMVWCFNFSEPFSELLLLSTTSIADLNPLFILPNLTLSDLPAWGILSNYAATFSVFNGRVLLGSTASDLDLSSSLFRMTAELARLTSSTITQSRSLLIIRLSYSFLWIPKPRLLSKCIEWFFFFILLIWL